MLTPEHIRGIYEGFYKLAEEIGNPEYTQNTARIVKMLFWVGEVLKEQY